MTGTPTEQDAEELTDKELRDDRLWAINDGLYDAIKAIENLKVDDLDRHDLEELLDFKQDLEAWKAQVEGWQDE